MKINPKDLAAGAVFVVIGGFFAGNALLTLRMGSTLNMGPGFFPAVLGSLLVLLGIAIAAEGLGRPAEAFGEVSWRGIVLVIGAIVVFGVTVRGLGFGPSLFLCVFMAGLSSGRMGWRMAAVVAAVLTVFSIGVFVEALGLPYPIIGRWLGG